jgi:hypothetical protein
MKPTELPAIDFSPEQEAAYLPMQDMIDADGLMKHGMYEGKRISRSQRLPSSGVCPQDCRCHGSQTDT